MSAPLTPAGEAAIAELAGRYRVSTAAVRTLLDGVIRGGGVMAQFSHPDLGGSGQWMRGGMTMVGDMFNSGLQATVSGICSELASRLAAGDGLVTAPGRQPGGGSFGSIGGRWWPADLGRPSSSGGQNDSSYAYFPQTRRLAIRRGTAITLYDTGDHAISGVQQRQGSAGLLEFSSQLGTFTVGTLPLVTAPHDQPAPPDHVAPRDQPAQPDHAAPPPDPAPAVDPAPPVPAGRPSSDAESTAPPAAAPATDPASAASQIGAAIQTLAGLRDKGFLTENEFAAKKTELLARL